MTNQTSQPCDFTLNVKPSNRTESENLNSSELLADFISSKSISAGSCTAYLDPTSADLNITLQNESKEQLSVALRATNIVPALRQSPNLINFTMSVADQDSKSALYWHELQEFSFASSSSLPKNVSIKSGVNTPTKDPILVTLDVSQIGEVENLDSTHVNVVDFKPNSVRYFKIFIGKVD